MDEPHILTDEEMAKYITNPEVRAMLLGPPLSAEQVEAQTELFRKAIASQMDDDERPQISVVSAEYKGELSLTVHFSDGSARDLDFSDFFKKHPQHDKYAKPRKFKKFAISNGNLIWGRHADLEFPIQALYRGDLEYCE